MRVNVEGGRDYRTVWVPNREKGEIHMIDQRQIPLEFTIFTSSKVDDTCFATLDMIVRGAGAIGTLNGYGMWQGFREKDPLDAKIRLESTRPTANNLTYATNRVFDVGMKSTNTDYDTWFEAERIANEDVEACKKIGEVGAHLIKDGDGILTHCDAGWLAFTDWGSAHAPMYVAHRAGTKIRMVYTDETRPRDQGKRLSAWELMNEGIPCKISPDNDAATLMKKGLVNLIIVGADRIAANGDVANKIGTYPLAIVAKEHKIPFYVAAPFSTFDRECTNGDAIEIEERSKNEVLWVKGRTREGKITEVYTAPEDADAVNYAFDVTPAKYITGIITPNGINRPNFRTIRRKLTSPALGA